MGLGLPMGPMTLLDLIGLDTELAVLEVLQAEFGGTRYAPAPLLRKLCDARLFGRKSGRGFYDYRHPAPAAATADHDLAPVPAEVALISASGGVLDELASQITAAGISVVPQPSAGTGLVIVAADPGHRVLDAALAVGHPGDVIGIGFTGAGNGKPGLAELVLPDVTAAGTAAKARALAARLGLTAVISRDRPGFVTETLAYAQFNDAVRMFQDGYASPADIDTAMMLGCGYPRGPSRCSTTPARRASSPSWRRCTPHRRPGVHPGTPARRVRHRRHPVPDQLERVTGRSRHDRNAAAPDLAR